MVVRAKLFMQYEVCEHNSCESSFLHCRNLFDEPSRKTCKLLE